MKPILVICRQKKINRKRSLYGIGFIVIFSILTNLQVFWFYGFHTKLNMKLNCDKIFYRWTILIPAMLLRFLIPMILLTVTNTLTIRKVITRIIKVLALSRQYQKAFQNLVMSGQGCGGFFTTVDTSFVFTKKSNVAKLFFDICNTEMAQSLSSLQKSEFLKLIISCF